MRGIEYNTWAERTRYFFVFLLMGIWTNIFTGNISYLPFSPKCRCRRLAVVRHGRTKAVEKKEFMSDTSDNAKLSENGIDELSHVAERLRNDMPDVILFGPLERTETTFRIISAQLKEEIQAERCSYMRGINNSEWAGKTFETLDEENLAVFLMRECRHDIFVKTRNGDSWGDVLFRCARLLRHLNSRYSEKKVLLVSQGSVFQGMNILLHVKESPWKDYFAEKMFSLSDKGTDVKYGDIQQIMCYPLNQSHGRNRQVPGAISKGSMMAEKKLMEETLKYFTENCNENGKNK